MDLPDIWKDPDKKGNCSGEQMQALEMWCKYNTLARISKVLDVPLGTVRDWAYLGRNGMFPFKDIREAMEKETLKEIAQHKLPALKNIMDSSLQLIRESMERLVIGKADLSVDEMKKVSDIIANMDKIVKLDEGQATENISIANIDPINNLKDAIEVFEEIDDFNVLGLKEEEEDETTPEG